MASIASDKNVWNAALSNPVLQDFIQSNKNSECLILNNILFFIVSIHAKKKPATDVEFHEPLIPEKTEDDNDSSAKLPEAKESGSWFKGMFEKAKLSTVNVVNRLSSKFQDIFDPSDEKKGEKDGSFEIARSIIGLATMVIMVVVFKRI